MQNEKSSTPSALGLDGALVAGGSGGAVNMLINVSRLTATAMTAAIRAPAGPARANASAGNRRCSDGVRRW